MDLQRQELLKQIKENAITFGNFVLSSGATSHYYLDCRKVTLSPHGAWLIANQLLDLLADLDFDALGGPTLAADPIAASVAVESWHRQRPVRAFIVRKETKGHGLQRQVEGPLRSSDQVVVVDDTLTTGGSILQAIDAVEKAGATVVAVAVVIDRLQGGTEAIGQKGYPVRSLFTFDDIRDYVEQRQTNESA